jgi:hypothetical protein
MMAPLDFTAIQTWTSSQLTTLNPCSGQQHDTHTRPCPLSIALYRNPGEIFNINRSSSDILFVP